MSRIFDNIQAELLQALRSTLQVSQRADFCVGYLNLRGWQSIDDLIAAWDPAAGQICRVLIGMQRPPQEEIRELYRQQDTTSGLLDNATASRLKSQFAAHLREQITLGIPTGHDEAGLRRLARQLRAGQGVVKLFLPYPLHAKLYLLFRDDVNNPVTGFVGSSNLTMAGLSRHGELNVDVLDHLGTEKLAQWFDARWADRWALDVSADLAKIIETSWAREEAIPPHHIYLNIAYHLSTEARAGLSQFRLPARFEQELFEFQKSAVKIAARHLHRRGGVMIGDVVGLGKTMMATALARMFEDDLGYETLIICPKNLEPMWERYRTEYGLRGMVLPVSQVTRKLPDLKRYRLVLIDESHNLRNREGRRYKAISEYIRSCDAKVILLTATPYNKTKHDLSAQLRLFIDERANIGIRPERHMRKHGISEAEFERKNQCRVNSILAIEKSEEFDDWRELIRLYMVRRTRSFIIQHYTEADKHGRRYISGKDGEKRYFPVRKPLSVTFTVDEADPTDRYARLYSRDVVDQINALHVPRYGLGLYVDPIAEKSATAAERKLIENLGRAGKRLMGFCRTNLFKRLESNGFSFLQSIDRHILRNQIYLYAFENGLDLPVGVLDAGMLDIERVDEDADGLEADVEDVLDGLFDEVAEEDGVPSDMARAKSVYEQYVRDYRKRFKWIRPTLFKTKLAEDLAHDTQSLTELLSSQGAWAAEKDHKWRALHKLLTQTHGKGKVLVFTQFADTARYLKTQLAARGIRQLEEATGQSADPTHLAWRFSPVSNDKRDAVKAADELRVLIATDVLSEGQNLQDAHIIVNYDLPWAIIRLIQRAGRVDRIGQQSDKILCYSFVPADGVERLIKLRSRVRQRLIENREVVGSDETFFDDDKDDDLIRDLYTEKNGILDDDGDTEVDLASYAYQIWKNATDADPSLVAKIETLPNVVFATKAHSVTPVSPKGVLLYMRTAQGNDALAWMDEAGKPVTQSQLTILKAAACTAETEALPRMEAHHALTQQGLAHIVAEEKTFGGALGRPSGARFKAYERLKRYRESIGNKRDLFNTDEHVRRIERALEDIYRFPLYQTATDTLNRQLKAGADDTQLADLILSLREDGRLCVVDEQENQRDTHLICSMGLA